MMIDDKTGKLLGIAIREVERAPMILKERVIVTTERGVEGDCRGEPGDRQVTVITQDSWDGACLDLGKNLPWIARRANLLVQGIVLKKGTRKFLQIGNLILKITGETKPCHRMDEFYQGLQEVLKPDWRGGVTCRVVKSGNIQIDDTVSINEVIE